MPTREPLIIGPFSRGMNTWDDPTAIQDQEVVDALNFDPGLDGSLVSRPPFTLRSSNLFLGDTGKPRFLGWYYDTSNKAWGIFSDGLSSTYAYDSTANTWTLITSTFAANDMQQFNNQAWLLAPNASANPGGYWIPNTFTADANMPKGESITSYKSRLWVATGASSTTPTRVLYSKVLGQANFWTTPGSVDVGSGDGQSVVKLVTYFDTLLVFRSQSTWSFQYTSDPATGIQSVLIPGVGLQDRWSLGSFENFLYFLYDGAAYEFINSKATQLNTKVPFVFDSADNNVTQWPYGVSVYANRVLYSYFDNIFVFNLKTRTWTRWSSDVFGAIGQITNPLNTTIDEAYGVVSLDVPNAAEIRRNQIVNPSGGTTAGSSGTATLSPQWFGSGNTGTTAWTVGAANGADNYMRKTWSTAPTTSVGDIAFSFATAWVLPGSTFTISYYWRKSGSWAPNQNFMYVDWLDAGGAILSSVSGASFPNPGVSTWQRVSATFTAPIGAVKANIKHVLSTAAGVAVGMTVDGSAPLLEMGSTLGAFFYGRTSRDSTATSYWTGTADASASAQKNSRMFQLLHIQETLDPSYSELFSASVQTKNYNFGLAGTFKVLFWWGLDAVFRTHVNGTASPVVFSNAISWGDLLTKGFTWNSVRQNTWSHPAMADPSVVSNINISNSGNSRKFVRFIGKMRFRQLYFKVRFDLDGSPATSPVKLFTISAYMNEKQTVNKQIS